MLLVVWFLTKNRQWLKLSANMNSSNRKSMNNLTKNRSAEIVTVIHTSFPFFFASRKKLADPTYSKNVYSIGHRHSFVTLATSHYFSEIITLWKPLCTPIWTDFKGPIAPRTATENLEQILSQDQLDWKNNDIKRLKFYKSLQMDRSVIKSNQA